MIKLSRYIIATLMFCLSLTTLANSGLESCTGLQDPFVDLTQLVLDPTLPNPPQVQLCHRAANAAKHYEWERIPKTVNELEKFITEVNQSTPTHLTQVEADALVSEAERVIQIITGALTLGKISGGVFNYSTNSPVPSASITLTFSETGTSFATSSDTNGLFSIDNVEPEGAFIVTAEDGSGTFGSVQGSILETNLQTSVIILIAQPGAGSIQGQVHFGDGTPADNALVTAIFPETERKYTVLTDVDGNYALNQLQFDGTVIVIAFDSETGASTSFSSVVSSSFPAPTVNLTLQTPPFVNPELINTGFTDGLNGWYSSGPVQIIDRNLIFGSQAN